MSQMTQFYVLTHFYVFCDAAIQQRCIVFKLRANSGLDVHENFAQIANLYLFISLKWILFCGEPLV